MAQKIQIKRGSKAGLPTLAPGEFGLCTDTKELFVGTSSGNVQISLKTDLTAHINNQNNPHDVTAKQLGALAAVAAYYGYSTADGVLDTLIDPTAIVCLSSSINPDLWETLEKSSWAYVIQIFYNRIDAASAHMQLATGSNGRFAIRYYSSTSGGWGNWSAMATEDDLNAHINNKNNPHNVTAAQVGADPAGTAAAVQQALAQQITALTAQLSGKSSVQTGSYVGTGSSTLNLDLPVEPKALILAGSYQAPLAISGVGNYYCIYDNVSGKSVDVTEFGKHVSLEGENTYSAYNASGSTYFWTVLY